MRSGVFTTDVSGALTEGEELVILSARAEIASRACDSSRLGRILEVLLGLRTARTTASGLNAGLDAENEAREAESECERSLRYA